MPNVPSLMKCDGLTWFLRPGSSDRIGPGPHEHDIWRFARSFGGPGGVFIDVGAHVGHFAVRMAEAFAKVIAIEPNRAALHALRLNLRLNDIRNVDVHPVAAHDSKTRLRLWDPLNGLGGPWTRTLDANEPAAIPAGCKGSELFSSDDGFGAFLGDVEAVPIDLITSGADERVRFIKIDIEGHEGKALAGAARTIGEHQPAILIEMHDSMYGKQIKDQVIEQLSLHDYAWCGFSLYQKSKVTRSDMCPYIYAEPVSTGRVQDMLDFAEQANQDAASRWLTVP